MSRYNFDNLVLKAGVDGEAQKSLRLLVEDSNHNSEDVRDKAFALYRMIGSYPHDKCIYGLINTRGEDGYKDAVFIIKAMLKYFPKVMDELILMHYEDAVEWLRFQIDLHENSCHNSW